MENVQETPIKKDSSTGRKIYNSQDDSGDDLFDEVDTIPTLPWVKQTQHPDSSLSSYPKMTQSTQPLNSTQRNNVLVPNSSPAPSSPQHTPLKVLPSGRTHSMARPGLLASVMAPPGTTFRAPLVQNAPARAQPIVIDSDDEGMRYCGDDSDDEQSRKHDIKPTVLKSRNQAAQNSDRDRFSSIIRNSYLNGLHKAPGKRSSESPGSSPRPTKAARPYGSLGSTHTQRRDETIDDIDDYYERKKVKEMREILPDCSIRRLRNALASKRQNKEDALAYLLTSEKAAIDITSESDVEALDEEAQSRNPGFKSSKPSAKQTLQAPVKSIRQKYAERPPPVVKQPSATQAKPSSNFLSIDQPEKRKGIKRGTRPRTPSPPSSPPLKSVSGVETPVEELDSDVEVDSDVEPDIQSSSVAEKGLLDFFNNCSIADLVDLASISRHNAEYILSHKPFSSLQQIRGIDFKSKAVKTTRRTARTLGNKIVDACEEMWAGYGAIEQLLGACETISRPVKNELEQWGVDVSGALVEGSIDIVSTTSGPDTTTQVSKDSGLRTPVSLEQSADEDADAVKATLTTALNKNFNQPSNLGDNVQLKEYQKFGVAWLMLLFRNRLSCILADDMGLGKTCQVIAFLARLKEHDDLLKAQRQDQENGPDEDRKEERTADEDSEEEEQSDEYEERSENEVEEQQDGKSKQQKGPHIIVVPASTLENWLREFQMFCPSLHVVPYHGPQAERLEIRVEIAEIKPDVIVTTYDTAKRPDDRIFLNKQRPRVCVFDEGHSLKNSQSQVYRQLMRINCSFRLLLTGTPLQNNLKELTSLLGFIMPRLFGKHQQDLSSIFRHRATTTAEDTHEALLSTQRINKARAMMAPFVLRRKKHQVLKHIPPKTHRMEYCEMTPVQAELYAAQLQRVKEEMAAPKKFKKRENVLMTLRQAAIHPWLFRLGYDDSKLQAIAMDYVKEFPSSTYELVLEDITIMTDAELYYMTTQNPETSYFLNKHTLPGEPWMDSGKVEKLVALLLDYRAAGDRVLVFSQFKLVLNILEYVLETVDIKYSRLDGETAIEERQALLDQFYEKPEITCFMLSTKAGGAGINLACANKVIVFDQSFNPQDDIQAENRAHRLGQTRPVEVVRLVTRGTVEEQILALGHTKLALDSRVAGEADETQAESAKIEKEAQKKVQEMLLEEAKKQD